MKAKICKLIVDHKFPSLIRNKNQKQIKRLLINSLTLYITENPKIHHRREIGPEVGIKLVHLGKLSKGSASLRKYYRQLPLDYFS